MARTAAVNGFGRRNVPRVVQPARTTSASKRRPNVDSANSGTAYTTTAAPPSAAVVRASGSSNWVFDAPDVEYPEWTIAEKAWAYVKSIALGIAGLMALAALAGLGDNNPMMGVSWYNLYIGIFAAPAIAITAWIPVRICTQIVRALRIRRGIADLLVGILVAGALPAVLVSGGDELKMFHLVFPLVGALCGFFFWRAQGYPGLSSQATKSMLDLAAKQAR